MATLDERPRWRVNEQSFVGHVLVNEGDEVYYTPDLNCEVGDNLSPLNDAAQTIVDVQRSEHQDQTSNADKRARELAEKAREAEIVEKESTDGPVPRPKGDTKTEPKPARGKKAVSGPADANDDDVG